MYGVVVPLVVAAAHAFAPDESAMEKAPSGISQIVGISVVRSLAGILGRPDLHGERNVARAAPARPHGDGVGRETEGAAVIGDSVGS